MRNIFNSFPRYSRCFSTSLKNFIDVKVPVFPESITQADIRWHKQEGDKVIIDEVIGELETDKTALQILSPFNGVITKLYFKDDDKVTPTDIVCDVSPSAEEVVNKEFSNTTNEVIQVKTPVYPESITEGDMRWHKNIGDTVSMDEVIGEIETDKSSIEVRSPCNGILTKFLIATGEKVPVDSTLVFIDQLNFQSDVNSPAVEKVEAKPCATSIEANVKKSCPQSSVSTADNKTPTSLLLDGREITRVKMTRIRQTISKRLKLAQNSCAMLTTFNEVDMSNLIELRKSYQDMFVKKHDIKLGFMSAFIKSSSYALQQIPVVNAYIDENEIVYHNYVDISVAVASPKGLVVPVIRDVQKLNFADIEKILSNYAAEAKSGKLKAEDMDGGTFTISNGGVFGSLMGTPIINPPQAAILGMHAINEKPVVVNGNIVIRPMMYLALTYDHRLIDGREAVTFLKKIKQTIEDPRIMLLSL